MYWSCSMGLCTLLVTSCSSTQKLEVWRGWYSNHGMCNTKHHNEFGLLSTLLEGFPRKALGHGSDTADVAIVSCHKSGRSPLDSFYIFGVVCCVWIPDCGRIFHLTPHKCSVAGVLDFLWARRQVSSREVSGVVDLFGDGVNVVVPGQRVTEGKT